MPILQKEPRAMIHTDLVAVQELGPSCNYAGSLISTVCIYTYVYIYIYTCIYTHPDHILVD